MVRYDRVRMMTPVPTPLMIVREGCAFGLAAWGFSGRVWISAWFLRGSMQHSAMEIGGAHSSKLTGILNTVSVFTSPDPLDPKPFHPEPAHLQPSILITGPCSEEGTGPACSAGSRWPSAHGSRSA